MTRLAMLIGLFACGGGAYPEAPPMAPPGEEEPPPPAHVDLATVQWPATPEPLPEGVPPWAEGLDEPNPRSKRLPQIADPYTAYTRAANVSGALGPTVLLCNVRYQSNAAHDPSPIIRTRRSRADLMVVGEAAGGPTFAVGGEDNVRSLTVSIPVPRFEPGDTIQLRLRDRDFIRHDDLATLNLSYEGSFPLQHESRGARAECRSMDPATVSGRGQRGLESADQAIAQLMQSLADRPSPPGENEWNRFEEALRELDFAVAWLGWASADIQLRRARIDALIDAQQNASTEGFATLNASLSTQAELPGGGGAQFVRQECRPEYGTTLCYVAVAVAPRVITLRMRVRSEQGELAQGFAQSAGRHEGQKLFELPLRGVPASSLAGNPPLIIELQPTGQDDWATLRSE